MRPEVAEASTPWSDIFLKELRTTIQSDPPGSISRYGVAKGRSCRARLRSQSKMLWLAILVIVGLLWAMKGRNKAFPNESKLIAHQNLDGLQFINSNDPSIRVRQLAHLINL